MSEKSKMSEEGNMRWKASLMRRCTLGTNFSKRLDHVFILYFQYY